MNIFFGIYFFDETPIEYSPIKKALERTIQEFNHYTHIESWYERSIYLSTFDISPAKNNIIAKDELVLIIDGRIDNCNELLSTLKQNQSISDNELILNAYEKWGENCVQNLIGDFAFVIWDKREQKLFCARDPLGIKPFYYYKEKNFIAFASTPEMIFSLPFVKKQIDKDALLDYLVGNFRDSANTELKNLYRLRPAHTLTISKDSIKRHQYWNVKNDHSLKLKYIEEYEELFLYTFKKAITDRLKTNSKTGILLSGGLDSNSILCMAEDLRNNMEITADISGYSAIFPTESFNEEEFILSTQKKWGSKIHTMSPEIRIPLWELSKAIPGYGLPVMAPQFYILQDLIKKAFTNNIETLLSGHGGDELLDSSSSLAFELLFKWHPIKALNYIKSYSSYYEIKYSSTLSYFLKRIFANLIPQDLKRMYNAKAFYKLHPWVEKKYLEEAFCRYRTIPWYLEGQGKQSEFHKTLYASIHHGYYKRVTEEYCGFALSSGPIELSMPFYDKRLVELIFSFPQHIIAYDKRPKWLLRKTLSSKLPEEILNKRLKSGYTFTMNKELIVNYPDRVNDLLNHSLLADLGLINKKTVLIEYKNYYHRNINQSNNPSISTNLWKVLTIESWLQDISFKQKKETNNSLNMSKRT